METINKSYSGRCVIYARFSSHNQTEQSIEGQMRDCISYAERNGIKIVGEYIDRAISAKTDNRPRFQQMIQDSEKGLFDFVLVWKLDRFSRNRYDSATYKTKLRRNGVKVISVMENISEEPEGILIESLLEGMAEYYSAELAQKIKRGMRESALKCKTTGPLPFGYTSDAEKNIIIDPEKSHIVHLIFEMYTSGKTSTEISEYLNQKGFKTQKGQPFNKSSIPRIISNQRYTGTYIYNDTIIPDGIPRIIDDETFRKAQQMLNKNKRTGASKKAKTEYILTTKLFCGHCKRMMIGESGRSKTSETYHYYKCSTKKRLKLPCPKKSVRKELIEDLVCHTIHRNIMNDETVNRIVNKVIKLQEKENKNNNTTKSLQVRLSQIDKSINNLISAIENGISTKSTKQRLDELEEERDNVEYELAKETISTPKFTRENLLFLLHSMRDGDINDIDYRKKLINTFINKIYLYDDKMLIIYNYSGKNKSAAEEELISFIDSESSDIKTNGPPIDTVSETLFIFNMILYQVIDFRILN